MIPSLLSRIPEFLKVSIYNSLRDHDEYIIVAMKRLLFNIAFALPLVITAQPSLVNDTIRIKEVIVRSSLLTSSTGGYKHTIIDSSVLKDFSHGNLSEIISQTTPLFIKSYGPGGIATTSFRGAGAGHTQLSWNEVNISSPMLGQADLSLIPSGFIDEIKVYNGGASMFVSTGGLGGCIDFETVPEWNKNKNLTVNLGSGSFDNYSVFVKSKMGGNRFQSVTRGLYQSGQNDFRFLNNVSGANPFYERRINAESERKAIMQEFYFHGKNSITSARLWYQLSNRNLPASVLMQQNFNGETQADEFLRAVVSHNIYKEKSNIDLSVAMLSDRLDYTNPAASINSKNHSYSLITKGGTETLLGTNTRLKVVFSNELNSVRSVNYGPVKTRNVSMLTASVRRIFGTNLGTVFLVREILNGSHFLIPDFSGGMDFRILRNREAFLNINFSRNSKVPSMNDLYWNPGGNRDLKNEYCFSGEISGEVKGKIIQPLEFGTDLTFFSSRIRDMIQWRPGQFSYWSPVNLGRVNSSGVEAGFSLNYTMNRLTLKLYNQYSFTRARLTNSSEGTDLIGKQIIYVPENQFNSALRLGYGRYFVSWILSYTGVRYTTADNSQHIPAYTLNNVICGVKIKPGKNMFDINLKIDNIFGISFQSVAYYPMPGRTFLFSIIFTLNNKI
jgi:outer membrane cobalamin receptor